MKLGAPEPIAALNRVRIRETGEPLVDIRDACPAVVVMEQACPYLRRTVAEMLNQAQEAVPAGHRLRVGTALRTLSMQRGGWDGYYAQMRKEHPEWPLSALRRATNRFFAPYDQPAPPGHCTGGAVDVALLDPDGKPLDMTTPLTGWDAAYTWSTRISAEARANRAIMVQAMLSAGFSNCREEFWHYSWGDSAWAVRVGADTCPYGLVEPAPAVEARFEGAVAVRIEEAAPDEWRCAPEVEDGHPRLVMGVFWAEGRRVRLRLGPPVPQAIWYSRDRKEWEAVTLGRTGEEALVCLEPDAPRVYLSTDAPAVP